jgi:signal transduction histidine kinase
MVDLALQDLVARYGVEDLLTRGVLIVDDDAPNLAVLAAVLDMDYQVYSAESAEEALHIVENTPVDVIITDQRMPEMTGVELLERVRETRPDVAGIVLTGFTDSPAIMSAINKAQVFRFLTKPWESASILAAVEQASRHVYQRRAILRLVEVVQTRNEDLALAMEELKSAQQRLLHMERLGTMGRLAAGVTHDLRNFLMGLALLEEEFQTRDVSEELKDTVAVGLAGIRNLVATLETMNQFARSGQLGVAKLPTSPETIVRDAMTVMRMDMEFRKRNVIQRVGPDLPEILGDRQKLTQVLVNLTRNAVQATQRGQTIVVEASSTPGGVCLAVEDEGVGIPMDMRSQLFLPFVSNKGTAGMGMGLYMARLVAESHGGTIQCANRLGGGTRLELALPCAGERSPGRG